MTKTAQDKIDYEKRIAAERSAQYVESGMLIGLGTGSTIAHLIPALAKRIVGGLKLTAVVTSNQTRTLAEAAGIKVIDFDGATVVDLTIDGADEFNANLDLIKGGGGALLWEKIVAAGSKREIIVADHTKQVDVLGKFPLPVEVVKFGWKRVFRELKHIGATPRLRGDANKPFLTDEGNYIIDCAFGRINDPMKLASAIDSIVGVVEHGLFINLADTAIIGKGEEVEIVSRQREVRT